MNVLIILASRAECVCTNFFELAKRFMYIPII